MSDWAETNLPCPCGKSSDAYAINGDGWGTCFSCDKRFAPDEGGEDEGARDRLVGGRRADPDLVAVDVVPLEKRGLRQETLKKYGYGVAEVYGRKAQIAPYHDARGRLVAQKVRWPGKDFTVLGDLKHAQLFGQHLCRGSGKMIVVTEGEIDAMSVCQAMGLSWPAVSIPNGATGAKKALAAQLEFLEGYDKVVLAFDNDEPGQEATAECVELFSPGKVAVADLSPYKDANDALVDRAEATIRDAMWGAKVWRPGGVYNMVDLRERIEKPMPMGEKWPWDKLNDLTYGFRPEELVTFTAGTGVGKSTLISEVIYSLVRRGIPVGMVMLEEGVERSGRRLIGMAANRLLTKPDAELEPAEFKTAWDLTLGTGLVHCYDAFGSVNHDVLLSRLRYMAKGIGCKVLFLDHISLVVSGADMALDERKLLDFTLTSLKSLAVEAGVTIVVVCHLRRVTERKAAEEGGKVSLSMLRGTQGVGQLSDTVIAAERDSQADDPDERRTVRLRVLKARLSGLTGPADALRYDFDTGRLVELEADEVFGDEDF